ncbi:hypothetical protein [Anthocerotibacter panamensis]|uniref:hypothetical protein n=1 Tax=Anthocerotibacter panamensis TaxID=2857077 RepID=UPI001C403A3B|nr:hypothetical protein [Anthocerotibacter panamensis]
MNKIFSLVILALLLQIPVMAQSLSITPKPSSALRNPIDVMVLVDSGKATLDRYDWSQVQVLVDGTDVSTIARTVLAGPLAVALPREQFLQVEQEVTDHQVKVRVHGFRVSPGPHRVEVVLPGKDGVQSLTLDGLYAVL